MWFKGKADLQKRCRWVERTHGRAQRGKRPEYANKNVKLEGFAILAYLHLLKPIERVSKHPQHTMSSIHIYPVINISTGAALMNHLHIDFSGKAIRLSIGCVLTFYHSLLQ